MANQLTPAVKEYARKFRLQEKQEGRKLTESQINAIEFLEANGLVFAEDFGYSNAERMADELRAGKRCLSCGGRVYETSVAPVMIHWDTEDGRCPKEEA